MYKYVLILIFTAVANLCVAEPHIIILGTAQDGGHPHIGCRKKCCSEAWQNPENRHYVVSLALVDPEHKKWWLFEATPDIKEQLQYFKTQTSDSYNYLPDGIFITHAHMGHYTGLMQLGREALGASNITVYALSKMKKFLETNGPWSQLVRLNNINVTETYAESIIGLTQNIQIENFTVPHRDEYSETAGFTIITPYKKYLFIPDIDKWDKWKYGIISKVKGVDVALVDATFYSEEELPGRHMDEIPHPFVQETMILFGNEPQAVKNKLYFIHMNHTNPLLWDTEVQKNVRSKGYRYAQQGMRL